MAYFTGAVECASRTIGLAVMNRTWTWIAFCLVLSGTSPATAQEGPGESDVEVPRIGVVLSGGGVKGFAHVGALRVIEDADLPVDIVTGTSMGSFIGGLYAIGYSVDQIDSLLHAEDWQTLFEDDSPRRQQTLESRIADEGVLLSLPLRGGQVELPVGLVSGQRISQLLARLMFPAWSVRDFSTLPVRFGALAADLANGDGVLLNAGHMPDAIRASISIPSIFDPVMIDGRTLIDGGVTRNLPAEDALALGADAIICVDVGEPVLPPDSLETLIDVMVQAVGFRMLESTRVQQRLCDVLILPDVKGIGSFEFDRTGELIGLGEDAAERVRADLVALRDSLFGSSMPERSERSSLLGCPDSIWVGAVRIEGASRPNENVVRRSMRLSIPSYLTQVELERAIDRAYNTQRFSRVTYRVDSDAGVEAEGATLVVQAVEQEADRISVGLRYDSDYQAAVLLRVTLADLFGYNTRLVGNVRLGEVLQVGGTLTTPLGFGPRARLSGEARVTRTPIDLFNNGARSSSVVAHVAEASLRAGGLILPELGAVAGIRAELFDIDPRIIGSSGVSFDFLDETSSLVFAEALLYLDTFDRVSFPARGARLTGRSSLSIGPLSSATFGQHVIDAAGRIPVGSRVSLMGRVVAGRTIGAETPVHYRFYAGGPFPFEA
ncbi:MAG: BamA/TamA family outer membrane protein, partial [Rhodothermales bacterium]|nr:BamA/TamA family outer membrane protein [Rhodothermales bacterium]